MKFRSKLFARLYRHAEPGAEGGGSLDTVIGATEPPLTPDTGAAPPAAAPLTPEQDTAKAVQAMFPAKAGEETEEAKEARLRDERGRFAGKPDPNVPTDPLKKPATDPVKDLTTMPEGLTPKAQERFQALANTNKELTGRLEQATQLAGGNPDAILPMLQSAQSLQQTFQSNGVRREQFDQGMEVIGMINRGDLAGAQQVMEEQLRLISLATGRPLGQIDALARFPDLRERVDALQISEADAIELARTRTHQQGQQRAHQQQQEEQRYQQQSQQAIQGGQVAVDRFCKSKMTSDLDYAKIEPLLLKEVQGGLLEGIPPSRWAPLVEKTYNLIKQTSLSARGAPSGGGGVLRPSGGDVAKAAPKNAFEAMFGSAAPAGYRE